jgi:hypothetical protein
MEVALRVTADNIRALVIERGVIDESVDQHRPVLHQAPHDTFLKGRLFAVRIA